MHIFTSLVPEIERGAKIANSTLERGRDIQQKGMWGCGLTAQCLLPGGQVCQMFDFEAAIRIWLNPLPPSLTRSTLKKSCVEHEGLAAS